LHLDLQAEQSIFFKSSPAYGRQAIPPC
jgi:hypothetical protein